MARRAILQNVRTRDTIAPPPISLDISQCSYNAREKAYDDTVHYF